ncbi:Hypothetical predicted protein [Olea europaea subsp. europaea]|uniref:ARC105/Med15 mediator subunit C-terminal domain-containing protein n=1 Tax=Olea europaea subsp. europaea TaxID=158383 RepID=A0A8S0TP22_OLEEU|nr:Hypothetical predicted protein [Olea europaea subsp. europaea]
MGSLQQNPVSGPQQVNMTSISSHSGLTSMQSNLNPLQPNSNMLPTQHVKQEQQMFPTHQQMKQQIQHRQQYNMQRQQFMQQQQQQQQQSAQLAANQMLQLHQMNETNEMKMRQQMGLKSGVLQQHHSSGQRSSYHQPLKPGAPFSMSSPQVLQAASPQANYALEEESREINERLIDTVVYISDEDMDPTAAAATAKGGDGTIAKCSLSAVALSPNLKSQYASAQMSPIQPLRVLVPSNYPNCSPILLDKFPVEVSKEYEDISIKAKSRFNISLRSLSQPMSLKEIARTWGFCALAVIIFVLVLLFLSMHSKVVEEVLARNMGLGRTA